ncbi:MAG: cytochrome c biogenesis protein CcsA [Bdellovibrionota bacterium]
MSVPSPKFFYLLSLHAFIVASILYAAYLARPVPRVLSSARWTSLAGFVIQTIPLLLVHLAGQAWLGGAGPFFGLLAWSVAGLYHLVRLKYEVTLLGLITAPLAALFTTLAFLTPEAPLPELSVHLAWVEAHVLVTIAGEALFGIAAAASALYLLQDWRLRNKHIHAEPRLPDLETLDLLNRRLILIGAVLLTVGLGMGFAAAVALDRREIFREPLVLAFDATWMLYVGMLLVRAAGRIGGRKAALLSMVSYLLAVVALVGANLMTIPGARPMHGG